MRSRNWKDEGQKLNCHLLESREWKHRKRKKKKEIIGARENILPLSNISTIEVVVAASGPAFERASAAYVEVQPLFPKVSQQIWYLNLKKYWIRKG